MFAEIGYTLSPVFEEHVYYLVRDKLRELGVASAEGNATCVKDDFRAGEDRDD